MTVTAILPLPAEFVGRRGAVFAPVSGRTPLHMVVAALAQAGDGVVIGVAAPLADEVRHAIRELQAAHDFFVQVVTAAAPGGRAQCIAAALTSAPGGGVLLHDIGWPLIGPGALDRVAAALRDGAEAVLPVCPATDSIKAVDRDGSVTATLDRVPLRTVQYPRGFAAAVLGQLIDPDGAEEFDELDAILSAETAVVLVDGDTDTVGVELPRDAAYLAAVIECRDEGTGR